MTFEEYRGKENDNMNPDLGMDNINPDLEVDVLSSNTKEIGASLDDHFVSLLTFQIQLKVMHWGTESYAEHNAYGTTYGAIDASLDALVESYQGYYGRIDFGCSCEIPSFGDVEKDSWLNSILECLNSLRLELKESDLQNMVDELIASVSKLKYLLTLK